MVEQKQIQKIICFVQFFIHTLDTKSSKLAQLYGLVLYVLR